MDWNVFIPRESCDKYSRRIRKRSSLRSIHVYWARSKIGNP